MALVLVTPPAEEPVSLSEAKAHVRKTTTDEDTFLTALVKGVRTNLDGKDGWLGRALVTQQWDLILDSFPTGTPSEAPSGGIRIPLPPLRSIDFVKYYDEAGVFKTLDSARYAVDTANEPGWLVIDEDGWPITGDFPNAVQIRFTAGYGDASDVPESIKLGMKMLIGHFYENRENSVVGTIASRLPDGIDMLLTPYRVWL